MVNDPIADLLSQLKNAALVERRQITTPFSKLKFSVLKVLEDNGYLKNVSKRQRKGKPVVFAELIYKDNGRAQLSEVKRISKPSRRVYCRADDLRSVRGGTGLAIISTSAGIKTTREAKKDWQGGELLCEIW